jgi:hypothetical protein
MSSPVPLRSGFDAAMPRDRGVKAGRLRHVDDWLKAYRRLWDARLDRLDNYLKVVQAKEKKHGRKK